MRSLSPEESALWARVASTIRPLSRENNDLEPVQIASQSTTPELVHQSRPTKVAERRPVSPGTTLDGSWDRRLREGRVDPDRIVDLHGMSLDGAWRAIDRAIEQAIASGDRVVLLITGHHRAGEQPVRRGAIRSSVHDWLAASRHAGAIAAVRGAHGRHGGGGSLYIILRRKR